MLTPALKKPKLHQSIMPTAKPVVIMGADPAGLTAAWELVRSGREVVVWESDANYVGGLARTVLAEGYRFDLTGQLFYSPSPEIMEFWRKNLIDGFIEIPSVTRIMHKGTLLDYPLDPKKAGYKFSFVEGVKSAWTAPSAQNKAGAAENLEQWLVNQYGRHFYEMLFKDYFEKIVGLPCDQISAAFGPRHLRPLPADQKTFLYPKLGPGQFWEAVANRVLERNNPIFLDRRIQTVHWDESGVTHITGTNAAGEFLQQEGTNFLFSIPLAELLLSLDPPPTKEVSAAARALRHRDMVHVTIVANRQTLFPESRLMICDPAVKVAHILNYKNWSPGLNADPQTTSLGMEYYTLQSEGMWNASDFDVAQIAIREIVALGILKESEVKDAFVTRVPKVLPIYDLKFQHHLDVIKQWVGLFANLQPLGRNGLHSYSGQDHAMMTAMLAVRNIQGGEFDCWKVDADAKYAPGKS
jgi:protoporphyrinogen oxidase